MNQTKVTWLSIAFILSFFAAGIPYWLIPYNRTSLPNALMGPGLLVAVFAALLIRSYRSVSFWKTINVVGVSVPAAVFVRVIVDGVKNPTSYNLWLFEIIIALLAGFSCALAGPVAGSLVSMLATRLAGRQKLWVIAKKYRLADRLI